MATTKLIAIVPQNLARTFVNSWGLRMLDLPLDLRNFSVTQYGHKRYDSGAENEWFRRAVKLLFGRPAARAESMRS